MKKSLFIVILVLCIGNYSCSHSQAKIDTPTRQANTGMKTIYDFKVTDISGKEFNLKQLKGKKVMIVNTASECGFTPQYAELEKLYKKYSNSLVILGFPSNDFGRQEPGENKEIAAFCQKNYGVTFPMMSKISVKGDEMHPLYQFLTEKKRNGYEDSEVEWNFQKYLVDETGKLVKVVPSKTSPLDESIIYWLENGKI